MTRDNTKAAYKYSAFGFCGLTVILASMAIAGWLSGRLFLAALGAELLPMSPATAVCLLLLSLLIALEISQSSNKSRHLIVALSLFAALFCSIVFLQSAASLPLDIESLISTKVTLKGGNTAGRMSPITSALIFAAALAVFFRAAFPGRTQTNKDICSIFGLCIGFAGLILFMGYIYGSPFFYHSIARPVAVTTALAFMSLGSSIVAAAGPDGFPSRFLIGDATYARLLRSFLPLFFIVVLFHGLVDTLMFNTTRNTGLAISISTMVFFGITGCMIMIISYKVGHMLDRSREAVEKSEQRFRALFEQAAVGVAQIETKTGRFVKANKKYCDMLGYSANGMEDLTFTKITHPDDLQADLDNMQLLQEGKIPEFSREKRYFHKNGSIVWVNVTVAPMWEDREKFRYQIAVAENITGRKQREEEFLKISYQSDLILKSTKEGIVGLDLEGKHTFVNPAAAGMLGYRIEELIGKPSHAAWHHTKKEGSPYPEEECPIERTLKDGLVTQKNGEVFWRKDNTAFMVSYTTTPMLDNGELVGAVLVFEDITERRKTSEALRESERNYSILFEESKDAVFISTPEGKYIDINKAGVEMFGYSSKEELLNVDIVRDIYINSEDREQFIRMLNESLFVKDYEIKMKRKDGKKLVVLSTSSVVMDKNGRIVGYQGIMRDITSQKETERELANAKKMETIGQLAGGVAHEVRNPLNAILSIVEALFKETTIKENPEYQPYVHHIRTQVNRLAQLMKDLLDLGKPVQASNLMGVSLPAICNNFIDLWNSGTYRHHPVRLVFNSAVVQPKVLVDSTRMQQVLFNLIENAAQHSPNGSEIVLQILDSERETAKVRISDAGKGIPPDKIDRVTEPFFTMRKGGTGLGLTLVKHFVESMGGKINIWNNDPPPGCTVELSLKIEGENST